MNNNSITIIIHNKHMLNYNNTNNILKIMPAVPENPDMSTAEQKLKLKRLLMLPSSATGDDKGKVQLRTHCGGKKLGRNILSQKLCLLLTPSLLATVPHRKLSLLATVPNRKL